MTLCDTIPDVLVPVLQDMMLMSLSCMELQLDQWLLTKGRSSAGRRHSVFCGRSNFLNPQQPREGGSGEAESWNSDLYLHGDISWVDLSSQEKARVPEKSPEGHLRSS